MRPSISLLFIHGIYQNQLIMMPLASRLEKMGYQTAHFNYQTLLKTPKENAQKLKSAITSLQTKDSQRNAPLVLITHSLGSLLAQYTLESDPTLSIRAMVSITPPFQGAAITEKLSDHHLDFILGQSKPILLPKDPPNRWQRHDIPLGVIAGDKPFGLSRLFLKNDQKNDGTVYLHETKIDGMQDHITLNYPHTEILLSHTLVTQIDTFIQSGHFNHSLESAPMPE